MIKITIGIELGDKFISRSSTMTWEQARCYVPGPDKLCARLVEGLMSLMDPAIQKACKEQFPPRPGIVHSMQDDDGKGT